MTVMIGGMPMEDTRAHADYAVLLNALFGMVDALYDAGVTRYITRLEDGIDLICAGYIALERTGNRKPGVILKIVCPATTGGNVDDQRMRAAIYRYAHGVVRVWPGAWFLRRAVVIDVRPALNVNRLATVAINGRFAPDDAARVYAALEPLADVFHVSLEKELPA